MASQLLWREKTQIYKKLSMKTLRSAQAIADSLEQIDKVFRGSLIIQASDSLKWKLYFRLGRLSWVTGGLNSHERLQRHLAICCPQITSAQLKQIPLEHKLYQEQKILVYLQGQGLIQRNQMASLMENIATEVLFDAIQSGETKNNLSCHRIDEEQNNNLLLLLPFLDINTIFNRAKQNWQEWENALLANYSPNLYPFIKQPTNLKSLIKNNIEQQIINSIDGKQNLRSIAANNQINVLDVTRYLVSLLNLGAINFANTAINKLEITSNINNDRVRKTPPLQDKADSDFVNNFKIKHNLDFHLPHNKFQAQSSQSPLVICVDDSPLICKAVKEIILTKKYRFLEILEPIKVLPLLIRNKPDLIFLDLMMPIINGYELCATIRKTPSLKDIPVIILTGKDGLIDRMRAKLVGSTDFMAKPVDEEILLKLLEKYLMVNQ